MKIAIASDLHLEIYPDFMAKFILDEFRIIEADTLVLAGDITQIVQMEHSIEQEFFELVSSKFDSVIYVPGNHEYYKTQFTDKYTKSYLEKFPKIIFMNNNTRKIGNIRFIGSTLWTDLKDGDEKVKYYSERVMNDYRLIMKDDRSFTTRDSIEQYKKSLKYIKGKIAAANEKDERCVVITHHAPSIRSINPIYLGSDEVDQYSNDKYINYNFFTPLLDDDVINFKHDALWIHGHGHNEVDYHIGNIRVVANPCGYPGERSHSGMGPFTVKVLEV